MSEPEGMTEMEYRQLGGSSLKVSAISLGSRGFGSKDVRVETCETVVRKAIDLGVNFFDTADVYGDGQAEEFLARSLAGIPRDAYVLATKGGSERPEPGKEVQNGDPAFLRKSLEASLRRLKTDYIDLYQLHNPDPAVPFSYTAEAFTRFIEEGKVRYAGVSNMDREELEEWLSLIPDTVSIQLSYSLLDRSAVDAVFSPDHNLQVSLIPWAPLFAGFLVNPPPLEAEKRSGFFSMLTAEFVENAHRVSSLVKEMASDYGVGPSAIALAYVVKRPKVATVPVGTTDPAHLIENLRALEVRLSPGDLERLEEAASQVPEPEILTVMEVSNTLNRGMVAVLPIGVKLKVPEPVNPGDRIEVNLWNARVRRQYR
jgi:aryl-alcohol dehydrogenase-like predicted oxidoreductase